MERLSDAVLQHADIMKSFTQETYKKSFLEYKDRYYPVIEEISLSWEEKEEKERAFYLETVVDEYLNEIAVALEIVGKNKMLRNNKIDGYRMVQALYTIPMIRETKLPAAESLAEMLVEKWKKVYPKYAYNLGDYETLKSGFEKKQFCYITTAVCETLGKPDNCYELTMFRQFRDGYLRKQPDGETLIQEYYKEAPQIIQRIDKLEDSRATYQGIWEEHLKPCLSLIEHGEDDACKEQYVQMVRTLEKQFQ